MARLCATTVPIKYLGFSFEYRWSFREVCGLLRKAVSNFAQAPE
jgi:hypothetical protein